MGQIEWVMFLSGATLYAISSVIFIYCLVFRNEGRLKYAIYGAVAGLIFHSVALALRWVEVGHGPYINMVEVLSAYVWVSVVIFLLAQQKYPKMKIVGFVIMPVSFMMMGLSSTYPSDVTLLPASLQSYWLISHVGFANLAFGSILVAVGLAILYLLKEKVLESAKMENAEVSSFYDRLPELRVIDDLMYRFVALGLIFITIMIVTGAIWANQTWGRYWGWDPTEIWSLVSWFVYAICLHLRMNSGWAGKRIAWLIIFSIFVLVFSLFGIGYVYSGLHTDYITT